MRVVLDVLHALEIGVLRPQDGVVSEGGGQDDRVCNRQVEVKREPGRVERRSRVEVDHLRLHHVRRDSERFGLSSFSQNALEDLEEHEGGDDDAFGFLDGLCEDARVRAADEVLDPSGGVDDVHVRSSWSRSPEASIPFRLPRSSLMLRTGISSIRPP